MRKIFVATALAGVMALGACQMTDQERMIAGGLVGAGAGLLTANALNANPNWTVVSTLAGAAVGTLVARNARTNECAYKVGPDRYEVRRC